MKILLPLIMICSCLGIQAQNSSFGLGLGSVRLNSEQGVYITADTRLQLSNTLGLIAEVGQGRMSKLNSSTITSQVFDEFGQPSLLEETVTSRETFTTIKTGLAIKLYTKGNLNLETLLSAGGYVNNRDWFGLLSGGLFLSTQISPNIVAGLPINYNYITWERDSFVTAGFSIRFHM